MANRLPILLNLLLILVLAAAGAALLVWGGAYGVPLALVGWVIAIGVYRRWRWAYFAGAAWALAGYQLAKEGLGLEVVKRTVMVLAIPLVILCIYLHEKLGRPKRSENGH